MGTFGGKSNCLFEGVSLLIYFYVETRMEPYPREGRKTCVSDTTAILKKLEKEHFPPNLVLSSIDAVSM